jgi:hypothetical protein
MIPPALLNFVSGLSAGAGINLLTSLSGRSRAATVVDSAAWIAAAAFLAATAHLVGLVERDAALAIDNTLTKAERRAIVRDEMESVRRRYRLLLGLSALSFVAAAVLVPGWGI